MKTMPLSDWAIDYVNLVLAVGRHDGNFVDAYYGPHSWKEAAEAGAPRPLAELRMEASRMRQGIAAEEAPGDAALRRDYLLGQLGAVEAHLARLQGQRFPFADEAEALYQVRPPRTPDATFDQALVRLDALLEGSGSVQERYQAQRARILVPVDRVDAVFQAAIAEAGSARAGTRPSPPRTTSAWSTSRTRPGPPTTGTRAAAAP